MAGGGNTTIGSSRRKSLDAEVNLVPFIDLLSMCICFLLMTAVWIQVGSLHVKQSHGTDGVAAQKSQFDLEVKFLSSKDLTITVKQGPKTVKNFTVKEADNAKMLAQADQTIQSWLKSAGGSGKDLVASAMITPKNGVPYGDLVGVLDVLRRNQIVNLGVVPVKEGS